MVYSSSSPPDDRTEEEMNDWDKRHKRRVLGGGKGQLDLVRDPNFKGFGESPQSRDHRSSSSSSVKRRKVLDFTTASQDSNSSPLAPRRNSPRPLSPAWGVHPNEEDPSEPSTFDPDEGYQPPMASTTMTTDWEEERAVQAALVPGRMVDPVEESLGTVLVEDSDEELALDRLDLAMEVPDSDEEDECAILAREIGLGAADDSGFGEAEGLNSSAAFKAEMLYDMDANPTSVLGKAFAVTDDPFLAPTAATKRTLAPPVTTDERASSSPNSLGRTESGILMPPPPLPLPKRARPPSQAHSPPRLLVADTQTQAAALARPHSPVVSRAVVDETQAPTKPAAPFGAALADAWAGQKPAPPRQATMGEFFVSVPRPTPSPGEVVVEDSQRVPSLGEQVAALAMLRDVREGRRRTLAAQGKSEQPQLLAGGQDDGAEEVEEVEDVAVPSSQPRRDECGVGRSPLKTPTVDRVFKRPAGWPVSPSKRARAGREEEVEAVGGGMADEGIETQWESYWTLASPSASLLAEYDDV